MDIMESLIADHRRFQSTLADISRILFNSENGYFTQGRKPQATATILTMIQNLVRDMQKHEGQENHMLFPRKLLEGRESDKAVQTLAAEHLVTSRLLLDLQRALESPKTLNRTIINLFLKLTTHMNNHLRMEEREFLRPANLSDKGRYVC